MNNPLPSTQTRLLNAARHLFFQQGFAAVSVDDICKAAGVQKGSFYHFFEGKETLLLAAMTDDHARWTAELTHLFNPNHPPLQRMANLAEYLVTSQQALQAEHGKVIGIPYATLGCESATAAICHQSNCAGQSLEGHLAQTLADAMQAGLIPTQSQANISNTARQMGACIIGTLTMARMRNSLDTLRADLYALFSMGFGGHALPKTIQ